MTEPLRLVRRLPAAPETVFAAWTVPDRMREWLCTSDRGEIVRVDADPVVGGRFSILEQNDGEEIDHYGRYLVVEPSRRLSFTLEVPRHFSETTRVDIELESAADACLLHFTQSGIDPDATRPFWESMLADLANTVSEKASAARTTHRGAR